MQRPIVGNGCAGIVFPPGRLEGPIVDVAVDRIDQAQGHTFAHAGAARGKVGIEQIGDGVAIAVGGLVEYAVAIAVGGGNAVVAVDVQVTFTGLVTDQAGAGQGVPEGVGVPVVGVAGGDASDRGVEEGGGVWLAVAMVATAVRASAASSAWDSSRRKFRMATPPLQQLP